MFVLSLSPSLWPRSWAEAERALPIAELTHRRSDLTVVLLGLTPLFAIYSLGAVIWLIEFPVWLQAIWVQAILMLTASMGLSVAAGVAILQWRRGLSPNPMSAWTSQNHGKQSTYLSGKQRHLPLMLALVVLPLVRGPAQRSGQFWGWTLSSLLFCVIALTKLPHFLSWWLAGFAILGQVMVTRLNVLLTSDMVSLSEACAPLPMKRHWLKLAKISTVMMPLVMGQLSLIVAIALNEVSVKPWNFAFYLLTCLLGNLAMVIATSAQRQPGSQKNPANQVSWWLLVLVLSVALASEVVN